MKPLILVPRFSVSYFVYVDAEILPISYCKVHSFGAVYLQKGPRTISMNNQSHLKFCDKTFVLLRIKWFSKFCGNFQEQSKAKISKF